ncbi:hypothetical protein MACJ_000999 [Theileria orientalis]|uniref:Uncharacterized protein n=1 Tax=Theileria orientalis TaxID=68886 RepID=A0A976M7F2_THEOR|nr:hypothetical protein MACJ_000999 [Theileria orientalis]
MEMDLSESLYAYDTLHKQGNNLIHEMSNKELNGEDVALLKKFGYQYYYHYLYHYFNSLRQSNPNQYDVRKPESHRSDSSSNLMEMDRTSMQNLCHTILMESVNLVKYYDVIPRDCSLAPIRLILSRNAMHTNEMGQIDFMFMWNMFDSSTSMKIFAQMLCRDYGIEYNKNVSTEFEKQIIESSIVECDFAMVIEMLALQFKVSWEFHQKFKRKMKIDLSPGRTDAKVYEHVVWDLLSSDWEIRDLITGLIDDYGFDRDQIGTIIYHFKRDILYKKKDIVRKYRDSLVEYSKINNLREPFISRNFKEDLNDDRPFLIYQTIECPLEMKQLFRSSYKERLQVISRM